MSRQLALVTLLAMSVLYGAPAQAQAPIPPSGGTGVVVVSGSAALVGAGVMAIGIPLLVVGIIKKRRAGRLKAGLALGWTVHPDLVSGAAIPALSLSF